MKNLKDWSCEFSVDWQTPLTVGKRFGILCKGQSPIKEGAVSVQSSKKEAKYNLIVLDHKLKSQHELFVGATSWKTGQHDLSDYRLFVGDQSLELKGPKIKIQSLLEKKTKMNLPEGSAYLKFPLFAQVLLVSLGVVAFVSLVLWFRKLNKYDTALIKLDSMKTSNKPYAELHKKLRSVEVRLQKMDPKTLKQRDLIKLLEDIETNVFEFLSLETGKPLFIFNDLKKHRLLKKFIKRNDKPLRTLKHYESFKTELESLQKDMEKFGRPDVLVKDAFALLAQIKDFSDDFIAEKANV